MDDKLSMIPMLEEDYNLHYEEWKKRFYVDNMTKCAPVSLWDIASLSYKKRRKRGKSFTTVICWFAIILAVVFWIIPGIYWSDSPGELDKLGTIDIVYDMIATPKRDGVYIEDNGIVRKADEHEIQYYMETGTSGGGSVRTD